MKKLIVALALVASCALSGESSISALECIGKDKEFPKRVIDSLSRKMTSTRTIIIPQDEEKKYPIVSDKEWSEYLLRLKEEGKKLRYFTISNPQRYRQWSTNELVDFTIYIAGDNLTYWIVSEVNHPKFPKGTRFGPFKAAL